MEQEQYIIRNINNVKDRTLSHVPSKVRKLDSVQYVVFNILLDDYHSDVVLILQFMPSSVANDKEP